MQGILYGWKHQEAPETSTELMEKGEMVGKAEEDIIVLENRTFYLVQN